MECQLNENRGSPDPAHLTNGGGGNCLYQIRDRIDRFQTISHDLCRLFSLDTAGIVEDQGAPCGAILSFRRGIGVKSQVQVKISGIRGGNGRGGGHIRGIADIPDT